MHSERCFRSHYLAALSKRLTICWSFDHLPSWISSEKIVEAQFCEFVLLRKRNLVLPYKGGRLHQWGSARAKAWRGLEHNMIWQYLTELFGEDNLLRSFLELSRLFCVFRRWLNVHTAFTMVGHLSLFHYVHSWCASHRPQMAFIIRTAGFLLWFVQSLGAAMAMAFPTVAPCPFASQQFWCPLARWQWRLARSVLLGSEKSLKSQEDSNWGRCFHLYSN